MPLRPLADDLFEARASLRMPGGMTFPLRMVVVRLPEGGVLLHSAVAIDDALAAEIEAIGPVRHVVAPSGLHHLFAGAASARWPDAEVWAPPLVARKQPGLRIDHVLGKARPPFADVFEPFPLDGVPGVQETVFFHHPTGTLVCTDLFFHIHDAPNLVTRIVLTLVGAWRRPMQSAAFRLVTRDRAAAGASVRRMLALPIRRAVPAHGAVVDADVDATLRRALHWMLAGAPALPAP